MKPARLSLIPLIFLSACSQLDLLLYQPPQTPTDWLAVQPYVELRLGAWDFILVQPTSTFFVFTLGLLAIGAGWYFLHILGDQRSRLWWGIALLLWGLGALFAGVSYEAFSYEIKCAGRALCLWTSWWELSYLVLSLASVDAMVVAQAFCCASGKVRRILQAYALSNLALYLALVFVGALVPVKALISFEMLLVFAAPSILGLFVHNLWRYIRLRMALDLALLGAWIGLGLAMAAYFIYLLLSVTSSLWARGVWFSENDVLHLGLIVWMLYLARLLAPRVHDMA
jgi:hypothetical protein